MIQKGLEMGASGLETAGNLTNLEKHSASKRTHDQDLQKKTPSEMDKIPEIDEAYNTFTCFSKAQGSQRAAQMGANM